MRQFIKPKEKFSVGLDIGAYSIKLAKIKFTKDTLELCDFDLQLIGPDLGACLAKIKEDKAIDSVSISVCGPSTLIRYVNFPRMNEQELRQALRFEAQKHIPFPPDEVNLDGYILKEDLPENKMLVLIAAVKKDFLNTRFKIIQEAGLKVDIVDIDSLALTNAFNFNYPSLDNPQNKVVALLNIGATISSLNILENGIPRLSRDITIAGNNFTQRIADLLSIDFNAAESLKLNPNSEKAKSVLTAVESVLANLADGLRTSFDYYESQSTTSVAKIFLSGAGSLFIGIKDMLASLLGIEVEYWEPLKKINIASSIDMDKLKALSAQIAVAIGLALRQ
jgi:type IV pilus assembly protein PilM